MTGRQKTPTTRKKAVDTMHPDDATASVTVPATPPSTAHATANHPGTCEQPVRALSQDRAEQRIAARLTRSRHRAAIRSAAVFTSLITLLVALLYADLAFGHEVYSFSDIAQVLSGQDVPGLSFAIGELRLPRVIVGALAGMAFGMAGASFQHMLHNLMASPDIIGITAGANTAAVFGIIVLGISGWRLSLLATVGGLLTAALVLWLSWNGTPNVGKLILMGIGLAAALNAATSWILIGANQWDMQEAQRWLTGSLADADWSSVPAIAATVLVAGALLTVLNRQVDVLRFGNGIATGLGIRVEASQAAVLLLAVLMLSIATATSGPIAFVSFLAGPIASRLAGANRPAVPQAGLVGASVVLLADIVAQHLPSGQLPVGVVTSLIGGPVLVLLMIRMAHHDS